jgi:hypothetical protein
MTDTALFTGEELVNATISEYKQRLSVVKQRYDEYHPDMASRRYVADEYHATADRLRGAAGFLAGDYDGTYCSGLPGIDSLETYRVHYADDSLRAALHSLVWAECYAGLRTRDEAQAADPYRH